jgi:tRNA 5-methylaminomethyl-2-thiouridine biosynthesis bifunctional protein
MGHLWQGRAAWRILDTRFADGTLFFEDCSAWQSDPHRPRSLHYVALCEAPCTVEDLEALGRRRPELSPLTRALAAQWWGLLPGFHRFSLDQGRVLLTLCVGDLLPMLKAQQFEADHIVFHAPVTHGSDVPWVLKALARCSRRGTARRVLPNSQTSATNDRTKPVQALEQAGFLQLPISTSDRSSELTAALWQFDPPWQIKRNHCGSLAPPVSSGRCVVIGAGLAGASVAAALARRGWQVNVLDQANGPAAGASGLPVGLVVPHVSRDDCVLSRLSRAGNRLMLQQAAVLLTDGKDWSPSGVLERQMDGEQQLPANWPAEGLAWSKEIHDTPDATKLNAGCAMGPGIWHPRGAWIKPAELVKALLAQLGITFTGGAEVAALRQREGAWDVLDVTGARIASTHHVVLANASGAFELLSELQLTAHTIKGLRSNLFKTQGMRGLLSWSGELAAGQTSEAHGFPAFPVNGSGSLIPAIPVAKGTAWFLGSSYQDAIEPERSDADNHAVNLNHLRQLLPNVASQLEPAFESGQVKAWKGVRCVTADRLPVVGPVQVNGQAGLWICAGMGSRGLSFSALCAELLAARLGGEPLPLEAKLADALDGMRGSQSSR